MLNVPMRMTIVLLSAIVLMLVAKSDLWGQNLKPVVPMTDRQNELLDSARVFVDRKDYDSSYAIFDTALGLNPAAYEVIYEQALAYRLGGKLDLAVGAALRGAQYDSPIWRDFYIMAAEIYGDQKQWRAGAGVLQQAIGVRPDQKDLLLPLGNAYLMAGLSNEARPILEQAVVYDPTSFLAHTYLAQAFGRRRYLSPMIMAFLRGMELDQNATPTVQGLEIVLGLCGWGVAANDTTPLQRLFGWRAWGEYIDDGRPMGMLERPVDDQLDEGNFISSGRYILLTQIRRGADGYPSNPEKFVAVIDHFIELLPTPRPGVQGFAADYYGRYLKALRAAGHVRAYCYNIMKPVPDPTVLVWTQNNQEKIAAYKDWASKYEWGGGR